jgi:hypothetical protein
MNLSSPSCSIIALDAGHVCQNLYLACEAIGAGAIAAYGKDEFTVYLASVGKKP